MIEMLEILQEIAEKAAKDLPEDVLADLKELSRLQADVSRCMMRNIIIDTNKINRINELTCKHFYHGKENEQTMTAAEPDTFDFGEAIRRLKKGAHLARKGWNGKEQYIALGTVFSATLKDGTGIVPAHEDIGSKAIAFVGTRGTQVGWLASQDDILSACNSYTERDCMESLMRTLDATSYFQNYDYEDLAYCVQTQYPANARKIGEIFEKYIKPLARKMDKEGTV